MSSGMNEAPQAPPLSGKSYLNFDLSIQPDGSDYRAKVLNSPGGQATRVFQLSLSAGELLAGLPHLAMLSMSTREIKHSGGEAVWPREGHLAPQEFGTALFDAVFQAEVRDCLFKSRGIAEARRRGLRLRLRLNDVPELAALPWEYLYDSSRGNFLVLSDDTPLVRFLELPERVRALVVEPPLRILVMVVDAQDLPQLNVEEEWKGLQAALKALQKQGRVDLVRMGETSLPALYEQLRRGTFHVFHFIGHGQFDEQAAEGVLFFADAEGRSRQVSSAHLGTLLRDHPSLRLALINACRGAQGSRTDPFAGTAQGLVRGGVPAVVAMQFPITDAAACSLAGAFYRALSEGVPVDAALTDARKCLFSEEQRAEWGTPVLYLRSPNGRLFDLRASAAAARAPRVIEPMPQLSEAVWQRLVRSIRQRRCVPVLGPQSGAGVLPSASIIAREWADAYDYPMEDRDELARVAQFMAVQFDPLLPKDLMVDRLQAVSLSDFRDPDEPHGLMADLPLPIYITTNYDDFMLRALQSRRRDAEREYCRWNVLLQREPASTSPGFSPSPASPLVFHLHGYAYRSDSRERRPFPESLVLTEDDYLTFVASFARGKDLLPRPVTEALGRGLCLFLGYDLADWGFRVLYQSMPWRLTPDAIAVLEPPRGTGAREQLEYLTRYYQRIQVDVYWGTAREFAHELRRRNADR